jgi:hypothetical protein
MAIPNFTSSKDVSVVYVIKHGPVFTACTVFGRSRFLAQVVGTTVTQVINEAKSTILLLLHTKPRSAIMANSRARLK